MSDACAFMEARLVAFALLFVPSEHVRIQPHGDHLFPGGQDHPGIFPEVFIRGVCVGVGVDRNFLMLTEFVVIVSDLP